MSAHTLTLVAEITAERDRLKAEVGRLKLLVKESAEVLERSKTPVMVLPSEIPELRRLKAENAELLEVAQGICDYFGVVGKIRDRGNPDGMYDQLIEQIAAKGSNLLKRARAAIAKARPANHLPGVNELCERAQVYVNMGRQFKEHPKGEVS